jgi:hypothetical protein
MSKIALAGNASGTGTITLESPNTNTDFTINLPAASGTLVTTGGTVTFGAGTAAAPSITNTTDTNTGIYFPAADTLGVTTGGTEALRVNSSGQVEFRDGTAALPSITNSGDTNTGVYFSSGDTVDIATGGTQRAQFDSSGNFKFNSGYGSAATAYGCRAWVNFDGTVSPPTIRGSGNVSQVTRGATGDYTITFTNAMPDANYAVTGTAAVGSAALPRSVAPATTADMQAGSLRIRTSNDAGSYENCGIVSIAIFR